MKEEKLEVALSRGVGAVKHGPFRGSVPDFGFVIFFFFLKRAPHLHRHHTVEASGPIKLGSSLAQRVAGRRLAASLDPRWNVT